MRASARYSVVVVTWECEAELARLVRSMNRHLGREVELVTVDNASSDDPAAAAGLWHGPMKLIRNDRNEGYGAAANRGVDAASGEAVVMLNPDTELVDSSLDRLAAFALASGAIVGPRLLSPDGSPQASASGPAVGIWPWLGALVPGKVAPRPLRARTEPWRLGELTRVAWLTGACVAASRELLVGLGPFDASIHMYGEDMDLGLRADRAGVPSLFHPESCRLIHHRRGSSSKRYRRGPAEVMTASRRSVLARLYGPRRELSAWRAHRLNLRLRTLAKTSLGRPADIERSLLRAGADEHDSRSA